MPSCRSIPCGVTGGWKWCGIAAVGKKLFCVPRNASVVLVIDAETEAVHTIPRDVMGDWKWIGIAAVDEKLFCAPCHVSDVLVIEEARNFILT